MSEAIPVTRRTQLVELGVFLFLILPSMALSFAVVKQGQTGFAITAVATILRDLSLLSLIFYFLWRNREPIAAVGWAKGAGALMEAVVGILLFPAMFFVLSWLERVLVGLGFSSPSTSLPSFLSAGPGESALATVLVIVVAVSEETIFRGYLCLRLGALTRSAGTAVVLSAVIFSLGHGYEGTAGVITVGVLGAILAGVYLWRRSLIAPMVMHFIQDFLAIVLLPNLGQGG